MTTCATDVVTALETSAHAPGPQVDGLIAFGFPPELARAVVRSRRLRVLDWLAQSGLSVVNVMPGAAEALLALAHESGLGDKYDCAAVLWARLREPALVLDPSGWLREAGEFEVLLIAARRSRPPLPPVAAECVVGPAPWARFAALDPRAREVHERLPAYDVPEAQMASFVDQAVGPLRASSCVRAPLVAVPGVAEEPGVVAELTAEVMAVLEALAHRPLALATLAAWLPGPDLDALLEAGVLAPAEAGR